MQGNLPDSEQVDAVFKEAWSGDTSLRPLLESWYTVLEAPLRGKVCLALANLALRRSDGAACDEWLDRGISCSCPEANLSVWLKLLNYRAYRFVAVGRPVQAIEMLVAVVRRANELVDEERMLEGVQANSNLAWCLDLLGDCLGARHYFEMALRTAQRLQSEGASFSVIQSAHGLHHALCELGEVSTAREILELLQRTDSARGRDRCLALVGFARARQAFVEERFGEAAEIADGVREHFAGGQGHDEWMLLLKLIAETHHRLGEIEPARDACELAMEVAQKVSVGTYLHPLLELRADIAHEEGDIDTLLRVVRLATHRRETMASANLVSAFRRTVEQHYELAHVRDLELSSTNEALNRANQSLVDARDRAEGAAAAQHSFLSTMSHELRTPLQSVMATSRLLIDSPLSEEQAALVATIRRSAGMTLAVVDDILDFRRLEAGRMALDLAAFPLMRPIRETVRMLRARAVNAGTTLVIEAPGDADVVLDGDERRLQQVVMNLVSNAVKFTVGGTVVVRVQREGRTIRVEIQDTGEGIAEHEMAGLFDPYVRAEREGRRVVKGTGLGLTISRQLVELFGGELGVRSALGEGATFWFEIPYVPGTMQPELPASTEVVTLEGLRVVLAEDHAVNRMLLERVLQRAGATVSLAVDGQEAVDVPLEVLPDVVLMDLNMPVQDGDEATRILRARGFEGCIIALTASVSAEDRRACFDAGMDGFLTKPVTLEKLSHVVRQALLARQLSSAS